LQKTYNKYDYLTEKANALSTYQAHLFELIG